ncbi:unnamed protein product [Heterobilharzia americana]|nr:unnamed protein product [Heterobilharzia americana]
MWEIQLDEYRLDFFDCRSQPWYLQASAYPKEMIILIDKSGSMKGRSDILSNATAVEILNTLTDNDYFNVMLQAVRRDYTSKKTPYMMNQFTLIVYALNLSSQLIHLRL